jgi:hypothetical protein
VLTRLPLPDGQQSEPGATRPIIASIYSTTPTASSTMRQSSVLAMTRRFSLLRCLACAVLPSKYGLAPQRRDRDGHRPSHAAPEDRQPPSTQPSTEQFVGRRAAGGRGNGDDTADASHIRCHYGRGRGRRWCSDARSVRLPSPSRPNTNSIRRAARQYSDSMKPTVSLGPYRES